MFQLRAWTERTDERAGRAMWFGLICHQDGRIKCLIAGLLVVYLLSQFAVSASYQQLQISG